MRYATSASPRASMPTFSPVRALRRGLAVVVGLRFGKALAGPPDRADERATGRYRRQRDDGPAAVGYRDRGLQAALEHRPRLDQARRGELAARRSRGGIGVALRIGPRERGIACV